MTKLVRIRQVTKLYMLYLILLVIFSTSLDRAYAANNSADELNQYLATVIQAWNRQDQFKNTSLIAYRFDPAIVEDSLPLTIVVSEDSGWTKDEVVTKVKIARGLFKEQCNIQFNPIMILQTKNTYGPVVDERKVGPFMADAELELTSVLSKPVFYFVASAAQKRADVAGVSYVLEKPLLSKAAEQAKDAGFIYRTNAMDPSVHNGEISPSTLGKYEILAHELGHVLLKHEGHSSTPGHFMSEDNDRTNVIQTTQCKIMKKNIIAMKNQTEERRAAYRESSPIKQTSLK